MKSEGKQGSETAKAVIWVGILLGAVLTISIAFWTAPPVPSEHASKIKVPRDMQAVKDLAEVLSSYKQLYLFHVSLIYSLVFIFLQAFSVPGTIFLSFLGGALYGLIPGILIVAFLSACGASGAYFMSYLIGRRVIQRCAPQRLKSFGEMVEKNRANLWNYFIFIRISPLLPNWFVNLASPIFSIPFHVFFIGTFIGVMPQSFIAVKAGLTIQDIESVSDVLDIKALGSLFLLAFLALIPTLKPVQNFLNKIMNRDPASVKIE